MARMPAKPSQWAVVECSNHGPIEVKPRLYRGGAKKRPNAGLGAIAAKPISGRTLTVRCSQTSAKLTKPQASHIHTPEAGVDKRINAMVAARGWSSI